MQSRLLPGLAVAVLVSCGTGDVEPIDLYEEDACSMCRMAISDHRFAGELISGEGEVFKFDDLGCMRRFRDLRMEEPPAASFVKDFETRVWITEHQAVVVRSGMLTPMNSGLVAFVDSARAARFAMDHPLED